MTDRSLMPVSVRALPNGSVLYHILNQSKLTRIQAVMRTGSIHEEEFSGCGLSHFLEHMLFGGCTGYPGESAADTIHSLGGECNAYTTFDHTAYYVEVPVAMFDRAADVITAMVTKPEFPQEKFNSEKEVIAREADMIFDRPAHVMIQQLWGGIFPNHPARLPIIGYPDKIAAVTRDMMVEYYLKRYGAMRSHWIVTGDLDTDHIATVLSDLLADFRRGNLNEIVLPQVPEMAFARRYTTTFADPLTRLAWGVKAPEAACKVTPALDLLGGILGGSDSSRLPFELICKENLALACDAEFDGMSFGSILAISAACEPAKQSKLEKALAKQLAHIRNKGVTAAELKREKMQQALTMYQLLKNTSSTVSMVNGMIMNFGTPDVTLYLDKLKKVTLEEINQAAFEYLDEQKIVQSSVSPAAAKSLVRKRNPENSAAIPVTGTLKNSSRFAVLERNNIPLDTLSAVLPAGPVWENTYSKGITQLLSKLIATGYNGIAEEKFYTLLDDHGIDLDVSCGNNTLAVELTYPPKSQKFAEDIFVKLLTKLRLDQKIFDRIRNNLAEQLASRLMDTNFAGSVAAKRLIFGDHPAGNSRMESLEELQKITLDEVQKFFAARFSPQWVIFGATAAPGKLKSAEEYQTYFENIAANIIWSKEVLTPPVGATREYLASLENPQIHNIELPREQNTVICAVAGGFAHTREYYALLIMDAALNGLASHLFKEVREKRQLAYSTGIWTNCGLVQGVVGLHAGVLPENAKLALECLNSELDRLINQGLTADEFAAAKLAALSAYAKQMECADARLLHLQLGLFYNDKAENCLQDAQIISSMSLAECNALLKEVLTRSPRVLVNAGKITS